MATDTQLYVNCIRKQLEELDLLTSIYCNPGELQLFDASVVSDFNEFISCPTNVVVLSACLDYTIRLSILQEKHTLDVRIELPHLYPALEHPLVTIHSSLLNKTLEYDFRQRMDAYILTLAEENNGTVADTYVFQIVSWIQEHIDEVLQGATETVKSSVDKDNEVVTFERLWIYSHHIRSKIKRQEVVRQSQNLNLSGFCRPGYPGIICVEGLREKTQEFWRVIRGMHWKKISICKVEPKNVQRKKLDRLRRFVDFKEQLFSSDIDEKDSFMNKGQFIKYLEAHDSAYMKKELFGLD